MPQSVFGIAVTKERKETKAASLHNISAGYFSSFSYSTLLVAGLGEQRNKIPDILVFGFASALHHQFVAKSKEECGVRFHFASAQFIFFFHFLLSAPPSPAPLPQQPSHTPSSTLANLQSRRPYNSQRLYRIQNSRFRTTYLPARQDYRRSPSVGWVSWRFMDHK